MSTLALLAGALLLRAIVAMVTQSQPAAFAATLLWICHPTVVISQRCWAAGRVDTHVVVPLLLAVFLHLRMRRGGPRWPVWLAALWALGTKESALCFPLLALGVDLLDPVEDHRARRLPAWPYLLLVPAFFGFRRLVLGDWIGGYLTARDAPIDPLATLLGAGHVLSVSWVPWTAPVVAYIATAALVVAMLLRVMLRSRRRWQLVVGMLVIVAGMFLPLVQLLPAMCGHGDQRWAYLLCALLPLLWTVVVADVLGAPRWRWLPLALLPLLWLLPARREERAAMDQHDRFVTSVVAAMRACDALLGPGQPVVLAGDAVLLKHPYRFTWGLASVLEPPWHPVRRPVLALGEFVGQTTVPEAALVCAGLPAWIEVHADGARVVTGAASPQQRVAPSAFDGTLSTELVDRLFVDASPGYAVGPGFDGRVALCTTLGSAVARVAAVDGRFSLRDVLTADIGSEADEKRPLLNYAWVPADMDRQFPIFLYWRDGERSCFGRLTVGEGFVDRYLELAAAVVRRKPLR